MNLSRSFLSQAVAPIGLVFLLHTSVLPACISAELHAAGLKAYENRDLRKLTKAESESFALAFKGITAENLEQEGRSPKPWLLTKGGGSNPFWVLLNVYPGLAIPDVSFVEARLFDKDWKRISKQKFPTGYRMFIEEVKLVSEPVISANTVVVKTISAGPFIVDGNKKRPAFEQGDFQLQHYGIADNTLQLIRLTDNHGRLVPNSYAWGRPMKGPEIPQLAANRWIQRLSSSNAVEVLATLVWLSGNHMPSDAPRTANVNQESVEDSKRFEEVRDSSDAATILKALRTSKNRWIREYADVIAKSTK